MIEDSKFTKEQLETFDKWWKIINKKIEIADVAGPIRVGPRVEEETPHYRPTLWDVPPEEYEENLEKLRQLAINLGASDAKIISPKLIPLDLRSLYVGCLNPTCRWLNSNDHCPMVRNFPLEDMQEFIADYDYAVVFKVPCPVIDDVPDVGPIKLDRYYSAGGAEKPDQAVLARNIIRLRILSEMVRKIHAVAYYQGYMMAAPISSGPCIVGRCADLGKCTALDKGGNCRFLDCEPVGSGVVYIDYHTLGRRLDWGELQVGGNCAFPEDVYNPDEYFNIGLVFID
ncbi:hypothetical protein ACFL7M_03700 [Thermodesulfobacteriota bacterium]